MRSNTQSNLITRRTIRMEFDINIWIKKYRKVRQIGELLKKANNGEYVFKDGERQQLLHKQEIIISSQSQYMNECGLPRAPILWHYNPKDESTWASSENFAYKHLLNTSLQTTEEKL